MKKSSGMEHLKKEYSPILRSHKLKVTPVRLEVLNIFSKNNYAISQPDLEQQLKTTGDRVTLYRTLHTFETKGIIHKIMDESGITKFAFCHKDCSPQEHRDNHLHFTCTVCNNTYCLEETKVPEVRLPKDFIPVTYSYIVNGICKFCRKTG